MKEIIREYISPKTPYAIRIGKRRDGKPVCCCSNCGKILSFRRISERCSIPEDLLKDEYLLDLDMEKYLFSCDNGCFTGYQMITSKKNLDSLKTKYPGVFDDVEANEWKVGELTHKAVTFDAEKQVLSIYESGYSTGFYNNTLIKEPVISRISVNILTHKAYVYENNSVEKRSIKRADLGTLEFRNCIKDKEYQLAFVKELIKRTQLPIEVSFAKVEVPKRFCGDDNVKELYTIRCGESELETYYLRSLVDFVVRVACYPNIFIRKDSYTGMVEFRKGIYLEGAPATTYTDDYYSQYDGHLPYERDVINTYIPASAQFRSLQPSLMDEGEYINLLIDKLEIPSSKAFKKLYRQNPLMAGMVHLFMTWNIKDINNIQKMVESMEKVCYCNGEMTGATGKVVRASVKAVGETVTANRFARLVKTGGGLSSLQTMTDIWRLYAGIKKVGCANTVSFVGKEFNELHDKLSAIFNKLKLDNKEIKATRIEKSRIFDTSRYSVCLAEDTYRLIDIGDKMHICVGGYGPSAVAKKCTIYYIFDKVVQKYAACIELRQNRLVQAKGYCNQFLLGDVADTLFKWVRHNNINHEGCCDYDYATIENKAVA